MEAAECGAASLAMILAYYGKWLPLGQVRYDCGVSRDGSNLRNVSQAAKNYGLQTKAYSIENLDELKELPLPCIAHWNFEHFVVVTGIGRDKVFINDPARGKIKASIQEADEALTGVVLTFAPGPDFRRGGHRASIASFVLERLQGAKEALLFTFITGMIIAFAGVAAKIFTQVFADDILTRRNPEWFPLFMILFGCLFLVQTITRLVSDIYSRAFRMKLSIIGNSSFLRQLLRLPMRFFEQHVPGDLLMRQNSAATVASDLVSKLAPVVTNVALLVIYLFFMMRYNLVLAGVAALSTLINLLMTRFIAEKQVDLIRVSERRRGRMMSNTMASLLNIESVKAAGAEREFFRRWSNVFAESYNADVNINRTVAYLGTLPSLLVTVSNTVVLGLGAWYIIAGEMSVGMLMAFQGIMASFTGSSGSIVGTFNSLLTMRSNMERMEDVFRSETDPALNTGRPGKEMKRVIGKLGGEVELRNISFGYNRLEPPLVDNFNLTVKLGRSVALVGPTGCGKSTVANIIAGINQPWSGEVLYDGIPLSGIDRSTFVNSVAVVSQGHFIFSGTVADNIKMWDGTIEDFAMILACYQAQIHKDIASRPDAYESEMNEGGSNFSTGQLQRMEIAAALVREPIILILDEATSALDAHTESLVMNAVKEMGITLIIVAHRLSTVRDCDEIIVMEKGKAVERGNHEELMALRGKYYGLMSINAQGGGD
ncbi:MAG: cysteine peptidase family C39 domain-containing protein [Bacteroidales bacterium]|nr:cysteine peptidase family C39 domain-containing protein [Bacteroidales bacterium]